MTRVALISIYIAQSDDRIILFATGVLFSRTVLDSLLDKNIKPVAIVLPVYAPAPVENLTGAIIEFNSVSNQLTETARKLSIPVIYAPEKLEYSLPLEISRFQADYILVACWPYLLSTVVTGLAGKAALNIHPSLLPEYRGANPIADQLSHREDELGVTLHVLNEEFDQGEILSQAKLTFPSAYPEKEELEVKSAEVGTGLFIDAMRDYARTGWRPVKQRQSLVP